MARAWIITKDYLSDHSKLMGGFDSHNDTGTTGPRDASAEMIAELKRGGGYAFVMKDDDGEIYYRGRAIWDDEDSEDGPYGPLGDFGSPNAGCTSIDYPRHPEFNCG